MRPTLILLLFLAATALPGSADTGFALTAPEGKTTRPIVIAYLDTGINPYHVAFRAPSLMSSPGGFIPGYPSNAVAVPLTFDAPQFWMAQEEDEEIWAAMAPGQLYYVPGTRIVGAISLDEDSGSFYDDHGHGTIVADAGSGAAGVAPDSLIVVVTGGMHAEEFAWALSQSWIDVVVTAYIEPGTGDPNLGAPDWVYDPTPESMLIPSRQIVEEGRLWFQAAGNGPGSGQPPVNTFVDSQPPWAFTVGGSTGPPGKPLICLECTRFFDAATRDTGVLAQTDSYDEYALVGGTSIASPRMAGHAANLIAEARRLLGDTGSFYTNGVLAAGQPPVSIPVGSTLADGILNGTEVENLLRAAATPTEVTHVWVDPTVPIPTEISYLYQGYGNVESAEAETARAIMTGTEPWPARPWDDYWHRSLDATATTYWEGVLCRSATPLPEWGSCPTGIDDFETLHDRFVDSMPEHWPTAPADPPPLL